MRKRLSGIVFAKAYCAIGIIIFHYFCHSNSNIKFLFNTANSGWGSLFVTVFFAISGAVLYYNYPKDITLKIFYFKRWKSIFPSFYLCWAFFFIEKVFLTKKILWGGNPIKFLFTLIGIDGYFLYKIPNYYLVGEWFLGAIIMLYLLYPLLCFAHNKNIFLIPFLLTFGYVLKIETNFFIISDFRNFFTCIASFYFGMVTLQYRNFLFDNVISGGVSLFFFVLLCFVNIPIFCIGQIQGLLLFIVLVQTGKYIMKTCLNKVVNEISNLSLPIFLFQHQVILHLFKFHNPQKIYEVLPMIFLTVILTVFAAKVLSRITNVLLNSKEMKNA